MSVLYACAACAFNAAAENTLPVKLVVKVKETPQESPRPLADVGGFVFKRVSSEFKGATCPNTSNSKGELECRVVCEDKDSDLRLIVVSPLKARAPVVAGLSPPSAIAVEIEGCKVVSKLPLDVVYKTAAVMWSELQASSPQVVSAIFKEGSATPSVKPFSQSAEQLKVLAKNEANREAILQLSRFAVAYEEAPPERKPPGIGANVTQYAVGANSIVLQAVVANAIGSKANDLVKISPEPVEFHRSIGQIEMELNKKPNLNAGEIELFKNVRQIKQEDPKLATDKLNGLSKAMTRP